MSKHTVAVSALAGWMFASGTFCRALGQDTQHVSALGRVSQQALSYFRNVEASSLDEYLKSIRPTGVSPDRRVRLLASIQKEDIVSPSARMQAKLDTLHRILEYHDRAGIEIKILRLGLAWAGLLEGAAVVISEQAVDILTADELQAVVAHELAHEYFAAEYDPARKNKQYDKVKEVELRCDAVSIITMMSLGLNPGSLMLGVSRLTKFNEGRGVRNNSALVIPLDERIWFCQAIMKLVKARRSNQIVFRNSPNVPNVPGE